MFTSIDTCLNVIMARKNKTYGITKLKEFLNTIDNPQDTLKTIHIGGTNGKGSTTNYLRACLEDLGYTVGTFTSPHLETHLDRIRLNNQNIDEESFLRLANETYPYWEIYDLSMFEIDMIISILYFKEHQADYVVYEVGLGGLLDSTNVITPLVSAITNIGYDHMAILGNTLEEIAIQKSGIFKKDVPIFTTEENPMIWDVFRDEAKGPLHILKVPPYTIENKNLHYEAFGETVNLGKEAVYQVANSYLALNILEYLFKDVPLSVFIGIIETVNWPGRFEKITANIYLDGAHNEAGINSLVKSIPLLEEPVVVVFSALKDKPYLNMIKTLIPHVHNIILTTFDYERVYDLEDIEPIKGVIIEKDYKQAIDMGLHQGKTLLISGSLYFISEVRNYLLNETK